MAMSKKMNYDTAYAELTQILLDIQSEEAGLEQLSEKLKRATELADFCRQRLRSIEEEIKKINPENQIEF